MGCRVPGAAAACLHGPVGNTGIGLDSPDPGPARASRWWIRGRRIGSIERAAAFIEDVGFALLFTTPKMMAPTLWEAVAGEDAEPFATGMGVGEQKVWTWKDELPRRGLAWYGTFLAGRGSLLSPKLLNGLYTGAGGVDDHESLELSSAAHEIARALAGGPVPSAELRRMVGDRYRYQRGVAELQRHLLVTSAGVQQNPTGWPSVLLELTCERFDVGSGADDTYSARRFLDTMVVAAPADLSRAFHWSAARARRCLEDLESAGEATRDGGRYRVRSP